MAVEQGANDGQDQRSLRRRVRPMITNIKRASTRCGILRTTSVKSKGIAAILSFILSCSFCTGTALAALDIAAFNHAGGLATSCIRGHSYDCIHLLYFCVDCVASQSGVAGVSCFCSPLMIESCCCTCSSLCMQVDIEFNRPPARHYHPFAHFCRGLVQHGEEATLCVSRCVRNMRMSNFLQRILRARAQEHLTLCDL